MHQAPSEGAGSGGRGPTMVLHSNRERVRDLAQINIKTDLARLGRPASPPRKNTKTDPTDAQLYQDGPRSAQINVKTGPTGA